MEVRTVLAILVMVSFSFMLTGEVNAIVPIPIDCATGGCTFTISSPNTICNVQTKTEAQVSNDASYDYPYGLIEFEVVTESCPMVDEGLRSAVITAKSALETTVTLCFSDEGANPIDMSGFVYRKYGPTPANPTPHWYDFMYDVGTKTGADIVGNCVTLYFVDGQRGDDDLIDNNNVIVDQGGIGRGNSAIPTLTEWGMLIFVFIAGLGAVYYIRRQRRAER